MASFPPQRDPNRHEGEREDNTTSSECLPFMEKPTSPPSIEALISDLSLFEEPLLKDLNEEVISSLGSVYGKEVTKKVEDLLRDSTPFQMVASVSILLYLC